MKVKYNYESKNVSELGYFHICYQVSIPAKFRASEDGSQRHHCSSEEELHGSVHPTFTFALDQCFKVN
jgi:hypothetical protein